MKTLYQAARMSLLTLSLAVSGCFLSTDDDDLDPPTTTGGSVTITADIKECQTKCDKARTDCMVSCADNTCVGACDSKKQTCYTDCD